MNSRLDRLITLLDTGHTAPIRNTAAQQIGQIVANNSGEFAVIINKVFPFISSQSWETRTAAATAIGEIAKAMRPWDPPCSSTDDASLKQDQMLLSFEAFDLFDVLKNGSLLVASEGDEFDDADLARITDPKERLMHQKKQLRQRLGIGNEFLDAEFFTDADFAASVSPTKRETKKQAVQIIQEAESKTSAVDESNLSARERNRLKRKARMAAKASARNGPMAVPMKKAKIENNNQVKTEPSEIVDDNGKIVVIEHKEEQLLFESGLTEWPFEPLVEYLLLDLFSLKWHIRHGAALALREIIINHGAGAGKVPGVSKAQNEDRHRRFLQDVAIRLLCVLALDRFADFVSDQVVVPVRETCAQCLGALLKWCDSETCLQVMNHGILRLIYHQKELGKNQWEVELAGLIALKYWLAVRLDLTRSVFTLEAYQSPFAAIIQGLQHHNDDIRAVSSSALLPVTQVLFECMSPQSIYKGLVQTLISSLDDLDDLSSATASILDLLSGLLSHESISSLMLQSKNFGFVTKLFPFFRHAISSVRTSVLKMLRTMISLAKPTWADERLVRLVFQNLVLEQKREILDLTLLVWIDIFTAFDPPLQTIHGLVSLTMSPIGTPLDSRLFENSYSMLHDQAMISQDLPILDSDLILYGRILAAKALSFTSADISSFICSEFAFQRYLSCVLMMERVKRGIRLDVSACLKMLEQSVVYREAVPLVMSLQSECRKFGFELPLAPSYTQTVQTVQEIVAQRPTCASLQTQLIKFHDLCVSLETRVLSACSGVIVWANRLPDRLNPVIRSLVTSIKSEEHADAQRITAHALVRLVQLNSQQDRDKVNDRLIDNISAFLLDDSNVTTAANSIFTFHKHMEQVAVEEKKRKTIKGTDGVQGDASGAVSSNVDISPRGAEAFFEALGSHLGHEVFSTCPRLLHVMTLPFSPNGSSIGPVVNALQIVASVCKYLDQSLYNHLKKQLPSVCAAVIGTDAMERYHASKCLAELAKIIASDTVQAVISHVLPLASDAQNTHHRLGVIECIYHLVNGLGDAILPFIVFLVVPVLGRMSDPHDQIRFLSTNIFAQIVKLIPLESGVPDPHDLPQELVAQKKDERKFLGQLVGTSEVDEFVLPEGIKADLRDYQKQGVNWLAFLKRYGLHGILCDDMGLGKTLQSICILASDHYNHPGVPSLVICPSTLCHHWFHEIDTYAPFMRKMLYTGPAHQRASLVHLIQSNDVVITSYEAVRNDISDLQRIQFNYCILDEGHIIKNAKTKMTQAVKSIKAMKRLILSGTPIQNNVLELWSLFDFLMPGFLGTERQFNEKYGKPILASRDAKASSKEQEQGILALESLHRQVLPLVLRRMKEDVLQDLPPKIIQDYDCEMSEIQRMMYDSYTKSSAGAVEQDLGNTAKGTGQKKGQHVFEALQYLRKLVNHPALVLSPDNPEYGAVQHKLAVDKSSILDLKHAPKLVALQQLLTDCGIGVQDSAVSPHRALVFCQLKPMVEIIETQLFQKTMPGLSYMRLDGSVAPEKRQAIVNRFNSDPSIDVLLLTTHVGGLGLNLTGADTVIFVEHDWNPMKDLQAMDRAHRIGQKRVVNVYRLITKGTLEEKIMGLQKFKLNIASSVINEENSNWKNMDSDMILDIFEGGNEKSNDKKTSKEGGDKKMSAKEVLQGLEELWEESQYEDLKVDSFLESVNNLS